MHFMFTRAPGPACVNGCVCADPHDGHSGRRATASGGGFGGGGFGPSECSSDATDYRPEDEDLSVPLPFALLASRFSLSVLLAAFLSFAPPLSLLAMVSSLERAADTP